jgi:hypothetical protein
VGLPGLLGRVGYVDQGCAGACEALPGQLRARLRHRQPTCCPDPQLGLAGHQWPHFGASVSDCVPSLVHRREPAAIGPSVGLGRPSPPVTAPGAGNRHIDLLGYLAPGQALATELKDQLRGGVVSAGTPRTHGDAGTLELFAHCAPMSAQLGTDLPQGPALGVQVSCTLNVHRATVTSLSRIGLPPNRDA